MTRSSRSFSTPSRAISSTPTNLDISVQSSPSNFFRSIEACAADAWRRVDARSKMRSTQLECQNSVRRVSQRRRCLYHRAQSHWKQRARVPRTRQWSRQWSRSSGNYRFAAFNLFVPPDLSERQFWDESPQAFEEHLQRGSSVHYGPAWRAPGAHARVVRGRGREYPVSITKRL